MWNHARYRVLLLAPLAGCTPGYTLYPRWRLQPGEEPYQAWARYAIRGHAGVTSATEVGEQNKRALAVFEPEVSAIEDADRDPRIGLALSGGGIRSAAFAMGVLRGLHDTGVGEALPERRGGSLLSAIGYLSTVSGGGFAGGWYVSHPRDDELLRAGSRHLQQVAGRGNYLTSSHYSATLPDLAGKFAVHWLSWPFAALFDEVLHLQVNVYGVRDFYRRAIENTFLYADLGEDEKWPIPCPLERRCSGGGTMNRFLPRNPGDKPFWIVNTNLVLKDETLPIFRNRAGDGFEITPLWAGGRAVGYVDVPDKASMDGFWMQPGYAMAISGAALDSDSLTAGPVVDFFSYAANFDLGYWVRSWNDVSVWRQCWWLLSSPLPINRGLALLFPSSWKVDHRFTRNSKYLGLTDGGHFENLGAYALVRRGVRFLMIADATEDPLGTQWDDLSSPQRGQAFGALRHLAHLLELDFGLSLEVEWDTYRVDGVPTLLVGTVKGMPGRDLRVVVFKAAYDFPATLARDELTLEAEKARNPEFPDDSLLRQLFREDRFLAYERLGYLCVKRNEPSLTCLLRDALR